MAQFRLTNRGKVAVAALVAATVITLIFLLFLLAHRHDVALQQACASHRYECNHPNTWKPGTYIGDYEHGGK